MRTIQNVNSATLNTILAMPSFKHEVKTEATEEASKVNVFIADYVGHSELKRLILETENTLGHLYSLAYAAYSGTSFSPEKRAEDFLRSYSAELDEDLKLITEKAGAEEAARYKENYIKYISAWLSAKGRCLSSMITGPARFPVARNQKANRAEEARGREFIDWRERALKSIDKKIEAAKPEAQKLNERFERIKKGIISSAATIAGIDNGTERGYSRALFVSSITGVIKTLAKNGETDLVNKCLELLKELNSQAAKPIITAKNSIWTLGQQAEAARELAHDRANQENKEIVFEGGKVILNYEADRLQILFNEKPDADQRNELKRAAFKWAPSAGVWQRQLTDNATYATARVLNIDRKLLLS